MLNGKQCLAISFCISPYDFAVGNGATTDDISQVLASIELNNLRIWIGDLYVRLYV